MRYFSFHLDPASASQLIDMNTKLRTYTLPIFALILSTATLAFEYPVFMKTTEEGIMNPGHHKIITCQIFKNRVSLRTSIESMAFERIKKLSISEVVPALIQSTAEGPFLTEGTLQELQYSYSGTYYSPEGVPVTVTLGSYRDRDFSGGSPDYLGTKITNSALHAARLIRFIDQTCQ